MNHAHSDEVKKNSKTDKKTPTNRKTVSRVKAKETIKKPKKVVSDVPGRRTRSSSKAIMEKTLEKEKSVEDGKLLEKSTDLSKEEYVKSYSL